MILTSILVLENIRTLLRLKALSPVFSKLCLDEYKNSMEKET